MDDKGFATFLRSGAKSATDFANTLDPPVTPPSPTPDPTPTPTPVPDPTPVPVPSPTENYPSARVMSSAFKTKLYETEFPTLCSEKNFLKTYTDWDGYPTNFQTTDKKGYYDPNNVSVVKTSEGYQVMQCRLVPGNKNSNGKPSGTAMFPKVAKGVSISVEMMVRLPNMVSNWHIANLMWPTSEKWPADGEFDFLELDTGSSAKVGGFYHWMNGTSGNSQTGLNSNVAAGNWFTVGFEVIAGVSATWFVNGTPISTIMGSHVTTKEMRLVLQNENGGSPSAEQLVQYNYLRVYTI